METTWKIFKEKEQRFGTPQVTGEWLDLGIGKNIWMVNEIGQIRNVLVNEDGTIRQDKIVETYWKGTPGGKKSLGISTGEYVHRLVAQYFVANPNGFRYVKHVDGDNANNHASNLQWIPKPDHFGRGRKKKNSDTDKLK